jgi:signal transduction histidine kinase
MVGLYGSSAFAALPSGVCLVDGEGGILAHNPALERLLGWRLPERPDSSLAQWLEEAITDPAHLLSWLVALNDTLVHQSTTYLNLPVDFRTQRGDLELVSVVGVVAPWRDPTTDVPGAMVIFHDSNLHTDLEGIRSRFLSVVSHELGGPTTNIAAAADRLAKQLKESDSKAGRLIEIIEAEVARLERLLKQFLSISPAQVDLSNRPRDIVAVRPLLRRVARTFSVRDTGHRIRVEVPEDLPYVWGDGDSIEEALGNLMDNALRHSPEGTQISLSARARENDVLVQVADQGRGLSGEGKDVFRPCASGAEVEEAFQRIGLGLPIARALIRALGGDLWYESESGLSSCFSVSLLRVRELDNEQ